mgnify:CR=1 FL=1
MAALGRLPFPYLPPLVHGKGVEGRTRPLWASVLFPFWPIRPNNLPGLPGTPSGDPISTRYPPKHFRCPNTIVLYINLYL